LSIERFENGDVNGQTFNHLDHVYVAWLYVQRFDLATAIARFDTALKRLVTQLGAEKKYHKTVTWFFLLLINERIEPDQSWADFHSKNTELTSNSGSVLARYYTSDYLNSPRAQSQFVLPDRIVQEPAIS
jgi:hypothetical protein